MILCFEAWNGNLDFAVRQIQTGLRLIREWHESAKGLLTGPVSSDPAYTGSLEGELVRIFSRLDAQIVSFSEKPSPEYHAWIVARGRKVLESMPTIFETLSEASVFEEAIIRRGMAFVCHEIPFEKPPPPRHTFPINGWWGCREPKVLATLNRMAADSMIWRTAFAPLWKRVKEQNIPSDLFPAALMRNRVLSSHIGCVVPTAKEEDFDHYHEDFQIMIEMSEYMLRILEATGDKLKEARNTKTPKFNFDSYTVIPMFLTALKCRDPPLRRKAISLLLRYPRREGVCDSVCMGKLCEWAMKIEEEHIDKNGRVPGWARIHGVTLVRDSEKENHGTLTCEQRVGASSDEVVIKSTHMAWNCSEFLADTANGQSEHWMG
ncbi:hypothetical protein N431DRAFT_200317 [Stipitochalara longipes BDJ]|nr:hypothetical protein N431DRAFT_200317 [Stipitochalara longipes BDJ]